MWGEWWRLHLPGSAQRHMNTFQPNKILLSILPALMDYLSRWGSVRRSVRWGHSQWQSYPPKQTDWGQRIMTLSMHLLRHHWPANIPKPQNVACFRIYHKLTKIHTHIVFLQMEGNTNSLRSIRAYVTCKQSGWKTRSVKWATWYPKGKHVRPTISPCFTLIINH